MKTLTLIVTGAKESGKDALVSLISDIPLIEVPQAGTSNGGTVTIQFGRVAIREDMFLYMLALPSEDSHRFLWHRAQEGLVGLIVVHDAAAPDTDATLEAIEVAKSQCSVPWVLAPHSLPADDADAKELTKKLSLEQNVPVCPWGAEDEPSARIVVATVLSMAKELVDQ